MDDLSPFFRVSDAAVEKLHAKLHKYRTRELDDDLFEELSDLIERQCAAARSSAVDGKNPNVFEVYDAEDADYGREIYKLSFADTNGEVTLFGPVTDDFTRRTGKPGKILITVLTYSEARKSIDSGRWLTRERQPIRLGDVKPPKPEAVPAPPVGETTDAGEASHGSSIAGAIERRAPRGRLGGGLPAEREAFVLGLLRANPNMSTMGRDGIHARVKAAFNGIGMRGGVVERLRAQALAEGAPAPAPVAVSMADTSDTGQLVTAVGNLLNAERQIARGEDLRAAALQTLRVLYPRFAASAAAPATPA